MPGPQSAQVKRDKEELSKLFQQCRLSEDLIKYIDTVGVESLSDFVNMVSAASYESELKTLLLDPSSRREVSLNCPDYELPGKKLNLSLSAPKSVGWRVLQKMLMIL